MLAASRHHNRAFSLIELVIVIVIIGIIAAIAVPRMSRGAAGAADSALTADLARLRNAVDLFQSEHAGVFPSMTNVIVQLTTYSNDAGVAQATKDSTHIYGPYLRAIPTLPVGADRGSATVNGVTGTGTAFAYGAGFGWWYNDSTGDIKANTSTEKDARGVLYNTY